MAGTSFTTRVDTVVDGDTIRVFLDRASGRSESLRILALDTEEVNASGPKPVTKLGRRATERAQELAPEGSTLSLTLPGDEPLEVGLRKHRGNRGRLLVYVDLPDGRDFQEIMIREGFSPYFVKYGRAHFADRHQRYVAAERAAQAEGLGIWDQLANNGAVMRDYAALTTWWELRGRLIEGFREIRRRQPDAPVLNSRLDYAQLREIAARGGEATVFMELRDFKPTRGDNIVFRTGSDTQPFKLFIPGGAGAEGRAVMNLLTARYLSIGEEEPRRSYAYVSGRTQLFQDAPEMIVVDPKQVSDWPESALDLGTGTAGGLMA